MLILRCDINIVQDRYVLYIFSLIERSCCNQLLVIDNHTNAQFAWVHVLSLIIRYCYYTANKLIIDLFGYRYIHKANSRL